MGKNYDFMTIISKYFTLKRLRVANLDKIIKSATILIKTTCKAQKKLKELEIVY